MQTPHFRDPRLSSALLPLRNSLRLLQNVFVTIKPFKICFIEAMFVMSSLFVHYVREALDVLLSLSIP